ncbi:MAG TPA: dipeptidase [Armatimonadetes bacterium]|nr:dipeptidase [Armatimonadota bacterium]
MTERERKLREHIAVCHARAKTHLGATDADVERGMEFHRELLVCDSFTLPWSIASSAGIARINRAIEEHWSAAEIAQLRLDVHAADCALDEEAARLHEVLFEAAGVDCTVINAGPGPGLQYALRGIARFQQVIDGLRERWTKAIEAQHVRDAFADGRRAMMFSANNPPADTGFADGFEQLQWLDWFQRIGFRMMHLTYNRRNFVGDGCMEVNEGGLSAFGYDVVARMNELGIVIDTPHTGRLTTLQAAEASQAPIAASHTVCRAVRDHRRGKDDEQIRAIVDGGGYIGITCVPVFLREGGGTIVDLLDHVEHAIKVGGIDHVGIGTDNGYVAPPPEEPQMLPMLAGRGHWWSHWLPGTLGGGNDEDRNGSLSWVCWPYFTVGLLMRGYSEEQVAKIVGGNALRLFEEVARAARGTAT